MGKNCRVSSHRTFLLLLAVVAVLLSGCGHKDAVGRSPIETQRRHIAAAYSCMPKPVRRKYKRLAAHFNRTFKQTVRRNHGDPDLAALNAALRPYRLRLAALVHRYAPAGDRRCGTPAS